MESSVGSPGGALLHRNLCPDTIPRNSGTKTQPTDPPRRPMTLKRAPQPQPPMRAAPRGSGRTPAKIGFFHGYGSATQPKVRSTRALTSGWAVVVGDAQRRARTFSSSCSTIRLWPGTWCMRASMASRRSSPSKVRPASNPMALFYGCVLTDAVESRCWRPRVHAASRGLLR